MLKRSRTAALKKRIRLASMAKVPLSERADVDLFPKKGATAREASSSRLFMVDSKGLFFMDEPSPENQYKLKRQTYQSSLVASNGRVFFENINDVQRQEY